MPTLSLGVC